MNQVIRYLIVGYFAILAGYTVLGPPPAELAAADRVRETFPFWFGGFNEVLGLLGLPAYLALLLDIRGREWGSTRKVAWSLVILLLWPSVFAYLVIHWWGERRSATVTG